MKRFKTINFWSCLRSIIFSQTGKSFHVEMQPECVYMLGLVVPQRTYRNWFASNDWAVPELSKLYFEK